MQQGLCILADSHRRVCYAAESSLSNVAMILFVASFEVLVRILLTPTKAMEIKQEI